MEEKETLNVGVLGCGPIAQFAHLEACRKGRNTELYAICDVAEDLRNKMAAIHEPHQVYDDYQKMLQDSRLDAVIIATSDAFHVSAAKMALEAGKHVLIEKPIGTSVNEVMELPDCLKDSRVVLQVGHMKRFDPGFVAAKDFVDHEMGEPLALKAWYCDSTSRYVVTDAVQPIPLHSDQARKPKEDPKANKQQ